MRSKLAILLALPLTLGLTQCDKPKGPSPYSFVVDVEMTPEAEASMKGTGEGLLITAFYYGLATADSQADADVAHRIRLGYESNTYNPDARRIRLAADDIDESLFPKIVDRAPLVLLTLQSTSPQGAPNEKLNCHSVVIDIKTARVKPPVIKCGVGGGV